MSSDETDRDSHSGGFSTSQLLSLCLIVVLSAVVKYSLGILSVKEAAVPLGIFSLGVVALFFSLTGPTQTNDAKQPVATTPDCCSPTTKGASSESMIGYATEKPAKQQQAKSAIDLGTSNFFYRPLSSFWVGVALLYLGSGALFQRLNIFHPENITPNWWKVFIFIPVVGGFVSLFTQYFAVQMRLEERRNLDASAKEEKGVKILNAKGSAGKKEAEKNASSNGHSLDLRRLLLTDRAFLSLLMTTVWLFFLGTMVVIYDDLRSILLPFFLVYCVGVFITESLL